MNQPRRKSQAALRPAGTRGHVTTGNWKNTAFHAGGGWGTACRNPQPALLGASSSPTGAVGHLLFPSAQPTPLNPESEVPSLTALPPRAGRRTGPVTVTAGSSGPAGRRHPLLPSPPSPASTRAAQHAKVPPAFPCRLLSPPASSHAGSCPRCFTLCGKAPTLVLSARAWGEAAT